jgi:hypothetical protein
LLLFNGSGEEFMVGKGERGLGRRRTGRSIAQCERGRTERVARSGFLVALKKMPAVLIFKLLFQKYDNRLYCIRSRRKCAGKS